MRKREAFILRQLIHELFFKRGFHEEPLVA